VMAKKKSTKPNEPKVMTITFRQKADGELGVTTSFTKNVPVAEFFPLCGKAIVGIVRTCRAVGHAKGLSDQVILEAMGLPT